MDDRAPIASGLVVGLLLLIATGLGGCVAESQGPGWPAQGQRVRQVVLGPSATERRLEGIEIVLGAADGGVAPATVVLMTEFVGPHGVVAGYAETRAAGRRSTYRLVGHAVRGALVERPDSTAFVVIARREDQLARSRRLRIVMDERSGAVAVE
jgi:hypothetical protein